MKQGKLLIFRRKVNSYGGLRAIRRGFAVLTGTLVLAGLAQAATYRWAGDDGKTIYSQIPPQDGRPYTVIGAPPPPADAAGEKARLDALRQAQEDAREDNELATEKSAETEARADTVAKNCEAARHNISIYEGSPNSLVKLPDGTYKRLLPEEREAKLAEARAYLADHCN